MSSRIVQTVEILVKTGVITALLVRLFGASPAVAGACDNEPPTLKGLCNAYCEALDCPGDPNASPVACQQVLDNYRKKSGGMEPPCGEICDGIDNDGDGDIDEGFDLDGDGVARCCTDAPFFATFDATLTKIRSHVLTSTAPVTFTTPVTPVFELATEQIRIIGVADFTADGTLDVLSRGLTTKTRFLSECRGGEWQTRSTGTWDYFYFGGGDFNGDGCADVIGWDMRCCFMAGPVLGPGPDFGVTAYGDCAGGFTEQYGTFDSSVVVGAWQAQRVYNHQDATGDNQLDLMFTEYASGGASTALVYLADGLGTISSPAFTNPLLAGTTPGQPQNFGDMGDIDCNGTTDWVGGSDDDGNKGLVLAMYGNGFGGFSPAMPLVDTCIGCAGSGTGHGSGWSQLYDWNGDGCLDLLTSRTVNTGSSATIQYWENNGSGIFSGPTTVLAPADLSRTNFATPFRN